MYSFQFRPLDENGNPIGDGEWTPIADVQNPGKNEVQVKWDTLATGPEGEELYPDGYYQVRVMVSDAAGNFSQKIHTYLWQTIRLHRRSIYMYRQGSGSLL